MTSAPDRVDVHTVIEWTRDPDAVTVIDVRSPARQRLAGVGADHVHGLDGGSAPRARPAGRSSAAA